MAGALKCFRCIRCACECEAGPSCWKEVRVIDVIGRTAITENGPVELGANNHVRPGMFVLTCSGVSVGSTNQHRALPTPRGGGPIVPPTPGFDSPQRPARFSSIHVPQMGIQTLAADKRGVFLGEQYKLPETPPGSMTVVLDDGAATTITAPLSVDHRARVLIWEQSGSVSSITPNLGAAGYPFSLGERIFQGWRMTPAALVVSGAGTVDYQTTRSTLHYDGHTDEVTTPFGSAPVFRTTGKVTLLFVDFGSGNESATADEYALKDTWFVGVSGYQRSRTLVARLPAGGSDPAERLDTALQPTEVSGFLPAEYWGDELPDTAGLSQAHYKSVTLEELTAGAAPPFPGPPTGVRWVSPLGSVGVSGKFATDPADLTGATLTAFGHSFSGGTWAALAYGKDTEDGQDGAMVLHESGGVISAVSVLGLQTTSRLQFETDILRAAPGAFLRFNRVGTACNSWPPEWAFATCTLPADQQPADPDLPRLGENRALIAFDPWRDAVKQATPGQPASWAWPGRPSKRPNVKPTVPHPPPLPLALADVLGDVETDELLKRKQAPWRLPTIVEVPKDGGWAVSPLARKALAKRALYHPSGWPEELDDRTSLTGQFRLTFGEP